MRILIAASILASCTRPSATTSPAGALPPTMMRAPLALTGAPSHPKVRAGEPFELTFTLQADAPCLASRRPEGALTIVSVTRDGEPMYPAMFDRAYDEGLSALVLANLVRLEPAQPATFAVHGDAELASITLAPEDRAVGSLWSLAQPGVYRISAYYELPSIERLPADACRGRSNLLTLELEVVGTHASRAWFGLVFAIGFVFVGRRKRAVVLVAGLIVLPHELATAKVTGRPGVASELQKCASKFEAKGGDPAGVWKATNGPGAKFPVTVDLGSDPNNTFPDPKAGTQPRPAIIQWAPTSTSLFQDCKSPTMTQIARDPCAELYHELSHAKDIIESGTEYAEPCQIGYPSFGDVKAVIAENQYRAAQHLPLRDNYSCKPMPSDVNECRQTKSDGKSSKGSKDEECPQGGCAASNGDPHIRTFDGARYDLQVVGELVAVAGDGLEIQTRQQPFFDSTRVSINTAIAMRVAGHRIGVYVTPAGVRVLRDGAPITITAPIMLGDGSVTPYWAAYGMGYRIGWPDGTRAWISPIIGFGLVLEVALAPAQRGHVRGIFGNADGNAANDDTATAPDHKQFADAWRVTAQTSLFDYLPGESVAGFVDRRLPMAAVTLDELPARAYAEAACRDAGVTDPGLLHDCAFDVAITGHPAFAISAGESQARAPGTDDAPAHYTGSLASGATTELGFDGTAGSAVYLRAGSVSCPTEAQVYRPDGKELGLYYMLCRDPGRIELPVTGRYRVRLRNGGSKPTVAGLSVVPVPPDRTFAIAIGDAVQNGHPAHAGTLGAPGEHHRFTFEATAGQRVKITSLVRNCGFTFRWFLPTGIEGGLYTMLCGDPGTLTLPTTGRYTIQISADGAVGDYGFRIVAVP